MKTRFLTMLAILAVVVPSLLLGGIWIWGLVAFIIVMATYEFSKLSDAPLPSVLVYGLILVELIGLFIPAELIAAYIGLISVVLLALPVFNDRFTPKESFISISFVTFFMIVGRAFLLMYFTESRFIWFILFATYTCDTFAYVCGRMFGKHKLITRISPNKTIEGSVGGWLFGMVISFLYAYFFIDSSHLLVMGIASFFLPIFGQIGDLAFSSIKRCYGIKDFGNILPGHGGILDRVDSLLFNLVVFYFIFMLVSQL